MKNVELIGKKRAAKGTTGAKEVRRNDQVPCVLYGGKDVLHFSVDRRALDKIVHSPETHSVQLDIDGEKRTALLQDKQFHPVSDTVLHADFMEVVAGKEARVSMTVRLKGQSAGARQGGKMTQALRKVRVKALPEALPGVIELDVTGLELGESVHVSDIKLPGVTVMEKPNDVIASVKMPKKVAEVVTETAEAEGEEPAAEEGEKTEEAAEK